MFFAIQVKAENTLDDALEDAPAPVKDLEEWELIAQGGEGTADKVAAPPPIEFETRTIQLKTTNMKLLKAISLLLKLGLNGKKEVLFSCIRDSPHAIRVSDEEFQYRHPKVTGEKIPTWMLITPEDVPTVDGIHMNAGTEKGFFGSTNKENAIGAKQTIFLMTEKIERPNVEPKKPPKKRKAGEPPPPCSS